MKNPDFSYAEIHAYVRNYRNGHGDAAPYDVNGVIHFMLAALDNLKEQWTDADFEQIGNSVTEEQREMIIKIGRFLESFVPDDED